MTSYHFKNDLIAVQQRTGQFLEQKLTQCFNNDAYLIEAMRYALLFGGKRVRPFLTYSTGKMLGANIEHLDYAAAAIEAIHTYSLIHDDLPAMDDDSLRRGHPTCHIKFDEATAILAGDALQSLAFELLSDIPTLSAQQILLLVKTLAKASGGQGMCFGQSLDLLAEKRQVNLSELKEIHRHKTGDLIIAAVELGFYCSPHYKNSDIRQSLLSFSEAIGLAFQVQDDILDITSNSETLGKDAGSDLVADKSTYPKLLGLEGAQQTAQALVIDAHKQLKKLNFDTQALSALTDFIIQRRY